MRFIEDYRRPIIPTFRDIYQLLRMDEKLDSVREVKCRTRYDENCGYYKVKIPELGHTETVLVCHYVFYKFKLIPYCLYNAPETLQRPMDVTLYNFN